MPITTQPDQLGWFTPSDLANLFAALAKPDKDGRLVLIGGQSIAFWAALFKVEIPSLEAPYLTQDADFLGTKSDAADLAKRLGAAISVPEFGDATPNTAVLTYQGVQNQKLLIDFLSTAVGLDEKEVRKRAVPIEREGATIFVLHPLQCLQSRLENLNKLPSKRDVYGVAQAHVALEVVRKYIELRLDAGTGEREAIAAVKQVRHMALSKAGLYAFSEFNIDILSAVEPSRFHTRLFVERDWPNCVRWVTKKRKKKQEHFASDAPK